MITPTFLVALALLGNAHAETLSFDVEQNQMFEKTFDAKFQIKSAKLDNADFHDCSKESTVKNTAKECYNQSLTSEVHFIITKINEYSEVQFMVKSNPQATYTVKQDGTLELKKDTAVGQRTVTDNTLEETNFPLQFVPDAMQLIPKTTGSDSMLSREAAKPVEVKEACTKTAEASAEAKANCIEVSKYLFPVTVKAKMATQDRKLTLTGKDSSSAEQTLEVTFKPKSSSGNTGGSGSSGNTGGSDSQTTSAAAWLSHSAALVLANLAMVYLLP